MAINTPVETRTLKNGAKQDIRTGKIVFMPSLDPDKARSMQKQAVEKKREVIQQAANEAVQNRELSVRYADNAYLAEIAQIQQIIATTPEARNAVQAAEWLIKNTGVSEKQQDQAGAAGVSLHVGADAIMQLLSLVHDTYATTIDGIAEVDVIPSNRNYIE